MKNIASRILLVGAMLLVGTGVVWRQTVYAEEEGETTTSGGTSISLTPVSKIIQISAGSVYDNSFEVSNGGDSELKIEVYAAPYSYVFSDTENAYKLGFSNENNYTQLSRWITFLDPSGKYVEKAYYTIPPKGENEVSKIEVKFRVTTPASIPAGGQYAVIFAHSISSSVGANGIRTEASPGLVVYGRSTDGESIISGEISEMEIRDSISDGSNVRNNFFGSAKVKNTGNVDFSAVGKLKVEPILFGGSYETPSNQGRVSVIPDVELTVSDEWKETPNIGIYKVTWTVKVPNQDEQTIERIIFLMPPMVIIITIILLTILIVWIIIRVRKREERRSRLAI